MPRSDARSAAAALAPAHGTVHVHGAEVSTDQSQLWDYAETLALLVAVMALLAAAWLAMAPRPDADIAQPPAIAPIGGTFVRVEGDTRDVVQPDPDGAAATEVAVVRPQPATVARSSEASVRAS